MSVLLEEKEGEYIKGHTKNYIVVKIKSEDNSLEGEIREVMIELEKNLELIGKI